MIDHPHLAIRERRRTELRDRLAPLFVGAGPLLLEIGCGHGHFLTAYAQAHPHQLCVGIDVELDRIERSQRKRERAGLANLHFVRAEAEDFLVALPPEVRFSRIYILFPDPWPKRRHHKNRLVRGDFLRQLADRSLPDARILFRTDDEGYFDAAQRAFHVESGWIPTDEPWPFEFATVFQQRAAGFQSLIARRS